MPNPEVIRKITPYRDINDVLFFLSEGIEKIFGSDLVGIYLTGSLSYGDFNSSRSDIDLTVIIKEPAKKNQIESDRINQKSS